MALSLKNLVQALKYRAVRGASGRQDGVGRTDAGVLQVALMVAGLDGSIDPAELEAFDILARKCRASAGEIAGARTLGLEAARRLEALVRRTDEKGLVRSFLDEALRALPEGFAFCTCEDIRRAIVIWVAMGMSDGDYSRRERRCVEALRREFAERRVRRLAGDERRGLFGRGPDRFPVASRGFLRKVESLVSRYDAFGEDDRAIVRLVLKGGGEARLLPLQRTMVEAELRHPGSTMHNVPGLFRLRKGIDVRRLAEAFESVLRAHQSFSSELFRAPSGEIRQRHRPGNDRLATVETCTEKRFRRKIGRLVKPFGLLKARPYRIQGFACEGASYLFLDFFHALFDGLSFSIVMNEVRRAYEEGRDPVGDDYYGTVERQLKFFDSPHGVAVRREVAGQIGSADRALMPKPDRKARSAHATLVSKIRLPDDFDARLAKRGITRNELFLAIALRTVGRQAGCGSVRLEWICHGRLSRRERQVTGPFLRSLPVAADGVLAKPLDEVADMARKWVRFGVRNLYAIGPCEAVPANSRPACFLYQQDWGGVEHPGKVGCNDPFGWCFEEVLDLGDQAITGMNDSLLIKVVDVPPGVELFLAYDAGLYSRGAMSRFSRLFADGVREI